jgi:hypothetical protein
MTLTHSSLLYLDDQLEDLLDGEAEPLVEGDGTVAVLVHFLEHLLPLLRGGKWGRQSQPEQ